MLSASRLVEPAYFTVPAYTHTFGPEVADLAAMADYAPDEDQAAALDALFAVGPDGLVAAFEFALIAARQNLKTAVLKMAVLGWLFVTEQNLIVWSAHEMKTTKEAFLDLTNLIEGCAPLRKRLAKGPSNGIYRGNGDESIELASGQRCMFKARTNGGGRGLSGDRVILDEGFALKRSHMGSLLPTLSARPDPQVAYGSSAGQADSDVLRGIRDRGRKGDSTSLGYIEYCAPEDACADENCSHALGVPGCAMDDVEMVRRANPAMGRRISVSYIMKEREALPPEEFGRERMGWWDQPAIVDAPTLITKDVWSALMDKDSTPVDPVSFGIYVPRNRSRGAIGVAARRADKRYHVGIVPAVRGKSIDTLPGTSWILERAVELQEWRPCAFVIDAYSGASSLITPLRDLGIEVVETNAQTFARACGSVYDAVTEDNLRHRGSAELARAVVGATKRDLGDSWAWDRKDPKVDITQLNAITLALHGHIEHGQPEQETDVWGFWE